MIIKADATFNKFKFLNGAEQDLFAIPSECKLVSRKEGMKTMTSKKKRLAVANLAT
jgi:hypothetical protein